MLAFFQRTQGLPCVVLRFAHTQDAAELLDPESFFSGPRFHLRAKIRQQRAFGNTRALAALEPLDDGRERHLVQCSEDGTPYRMMIADARDIAAGVLLALDSPRSVGATLNLGPDEPIAFDEAVAALQRVTGLPAVRARMPGPPVDYVTSNARARDVLGFRPRWTFAAMVQDAAAQRDPS
jgi:UDP-glucose 4-epimerase